jgi:hypothetical protein
MKWAIPGAPTRSVRRDPTCKSIATNATDVRDLPGWSQLVAEPAEQRKQRAVELLESAARLIEMVGRLRGQSLRERGAPGIEKACPRLRSPDVEDETRHRPLPRSRIWGGRQPVATWKIHSPFY